MATIQGIAASTTPGKLLLFKPADDQFPLMEHSLRAWKQVAPGLEGYKLEELPGPAFVISKARMPMLGEIIGLEPQDYEDVGAVDEDGAQTVLRVAWPAPAIMLKLWNDNKLEKLQAGDQDVGLSFFEAVFFESVLVHCCKHECAMEIV